MKTFRYIFSFIVLSALLTVSVSAGSLTFSKNAIDQSVDSDHSVQVESNLGIWFLMDSETESVTSISQPDPLPLSFDDDTSKSIGLLNKSHKLSVNQGRKSQYSDYIFLNNSFSKDIIFPFHSFW